MFTSWWLIISHVDTNKSLRVCACVCVSVCVCECVYLQMAWREHIGVCVCVLYLCRCAWNRVYLQKPFCEHLARYALSSCEYTVSAFPWLWMHVWVYVRGCVCVYTVVRQERLLGNSSIIFPPGLRCPRRSAALLRWHWAHFGIEKWCIRPQRHCRTSLPPSSQTASLRWCSNNPSNGLRHAPSLSGLHAISTGTDY